MLTIQGAEFGQERDQRVRDARADARRALQEIVAGTPERTRFDQVLQVALDVLELALEPCDVPVDPAAHRRTDQGAPIVLCRDHVDELPPPEDLLAQRPGLELRPLPDARASALGGAGQDAV